ncbi:hypothetical protein SSU05_1230 [Streptococcus suis 05ZYH33]|nr:hypothetical protein SSU05_1230 [Streptococcus suis 05ZYH33]
MFTSWGLIGLGLYAVGYIFGKWLATGQIDLSNLQYPLARWFWACHLCYCSKTERDQELI